MQAEINAGKPCIAFSLDDPNAAYAHMEYKVIERYGEQCNGHDLYVFDEGYRLLGRCKNCGGFILVQRSEMHGEEDDYYCDFFPVSGPDEARQLNEQYDGYQIEQDFPKRYLMETNGRMSWSVKLQD